MKESKRRMWGEKSPSVKMESVLAVPKVHFLVTCEKISSLSLGLIRKVSLQWRVLNSCWLFLLLAVWVVKSCPCPRGDLLTSRTGWQPQGKAHSASGRLAAWMSARLLMWCYLKAADSCTNLSGKTRLMAKFLHPLSFTNREKITVCFSILLASPSFSYNSLTFTYGFLSLVIS